MTIRERENNAKSAEFAKAVRQYEQAKKDIMNESKDVFLAVLRHFADDKFHTAKEMAVWTRDTEFPLSTHEIVGNLYAMGMQKYNGGSRYEITVHKTVKETVQTWVLLGEDGQPTNVSKKSKGVNAYLINEIIC